MGEIGPDELGHRLIGKHEIEALWRLAECLQRCRAGIEPDRLITELGQDFLGERDQRFLVVDDHDRLAMAARQLGSDFSRTGDRFTGSR